MRKYNSVFKKTARTSNICRGYEDERQGHLWIMQSMENAAEQCCQLIACGLMGAAWEGSICGPQVPTQPLFPHCSGCSRSQTPDSLYPLPSTSCSCSGRWDCVMQYGASCCSGGACSTGHLFIAVWLQYDEWTWRLHGQGAEGEKGTHVCSAAGDPWLMVLWPMWRAASASATCRVCGPQFLIIWIAL